MKYAQSVEMAYYGFVFSDINFHSITERELTMKCFRCNNALNKTSEDAAHFYSCSSCNAHYRLDEHTGLCDRWRMPLSLVLYGVIFDKNPETKAVAIAADFKARDDLDLANIVNDIKAELKSPRQKVSSILNFEYLNEDKLRLFLKLFVNEYESCNH